MTNHSKNEPDTALTASINLEYVRNLAHSETPDGAEAVAAFHHSLFMHRHGPDLERFRQQKRITEDRLADLEFRLCETRERLRGETPHVPVSEDGKPDTDPNPPWNLWDGAMFWVAGFGVVSMLVFGVFNISFNLLESGIVTFTEHPIRAYIWAALLPVGALGVKVGWDLLRSPRKRVAYLWTCLSLGILALLVWVTAYASVYPALSMTTAERIANLGLTDGPGSDGRGGLSQLTSGGVKRIDMMIVAAQALAEICLSAVLGIYMTQLYARHRPVRLAANPTFGKLDQQRRTLEEIVARERLALAEAEGNQNRLEHQLNAFVAYAKSLFERETSLRRDSGHQKRRLLDQIAEQLKARLAAADGEADPDEPFRGDNDTPRFALDSR